MEKNQINQRESQKRKILEAYTRRKKGLTLKEAVEKLDWKGSFSLLEELVEELKGDGLLVAKGSRAVASRHLGLIPAQVTRLAGTFGFARQLENEEEMFIPGRGLLDALPGDIVLVEPLPKLGELSEGKIVRIVRTAAFRFAGTFRAAREDVPGHGERQGGYIEAFKIFRDPVRVFPGRELDAKDGDRVLAEATRRAGGFQEPAAEVIHVFGSSLAAKNCCEAVLASNNIQRAFPPEAVEQADELCAKGIHPKELEARLDLRDELIFTIDGADSKDLDDAVSIEKTGTGWKLGVHIADVSYYVTEQSPLDQCAFERGTSIYYADSVIPMLPEGLSNGICSLNPQEDRLAFSCLMELDGAGELLQYRFEKTVIRSRVKGVYREINDILEDAASEEILEKYRPLLPSIRLMAELAGKLVDKRRERGCLELESVEPKFQLDGEGRVLDVSVRKRGFAERVIEEFMLLANRSAAKYAAAQGLPFVYRIHEKPAPDRVDSLVTLLGIMGINGAGLREDSSPAALSRILESVRGEDVEQVVNHSLIRSMAKAKYSPENKGHFGLALEDYAHFTSPIRRYPDLSIHRILSAHLLHMRPDRLTNRYTSFASSSAQRSSETEVRAMAVERECEDCYKAEYMTLHMGEEFDGVITGVSRQGMWVELPNTIEGLVRLEAMPLGDYNIVEQIQIVNILTGKKYRIGDRIRVCVLGADVAGGKVDFGIPGVEPRPKLAPVPPKKKPAKAKSAAPAKGRGKKSSKRKHPRKKKKHV